MNFNANTGSRQPFGRKVKRVSDINAMGYSPTPTNVSSNPGFASGLQFPPEYGNTQPNVDTSKNMECSLGPQYPYNSQQPPASVNVFAQPVVQEIAMQYGQQLANTGRTMVQQEIKKIVPVTKLKYYFAVDTRYVVTKLGLLFFPFTHSDWSIKYEQNEPVQPRFEINAPDLYIPTMAYLTYVLVAGLVLGMQNKFSPEQIGIQASSALAWCLFELAIYSCTLYIANIQTSLKVLDLLAYGGYKFVGIITSILLSLVGAQTAYYCGIMYTNLALGFYLIRALKAHAVPQMSEQSTDYYDNSARVVGNKRLYFLLFVALTQPLLSWWLSFHLIGYISQSNVS